MRYISRSHPDRDVVIYTMTGPFSIEDTLRMIDEVADRVGDGPARALVVDAREQTTVPSADETTRILGRLLERRLHHRLAIVTAEPAGYGMGRKLSAEAALNDLDVEVFTELDEAVDWAGGGGGRPPAP